MKRVSFKEEQCLGKIAYFLLYRIEKNPISGTRTVFFYSPSQDRPILEKPTAQNAFGQWNIAQSDTTHWEPNFSTIERIVAEHYLQGKSAPFLIRYYSVGGYDNARIASFFVQEIDTGEPILSGALDFPNPATKQQMEKFFPTVTDNTAWKTWANSSFVAEHHVSPILRIREENIDYVGLYTEGKLFSYPEGYAKGSVPFGSEEKFLAIADITSEQWDDALDQYKGCFHFWNLICRHDSLERVFIQGEPGAGKELWYEAIQGGVRARLKGLWKSIAATLPAAQLDDLLYGEQSGTLERIGYLRQCEGGGIFLDEIGKSENVFRKNLLRVLESKEFMPRGGQPSNFRQLLFVFASTNQDRKKAADPPDFWTRMDVELALPLPISLRKGRLWGKISISDVDAARLHSLFAQFWFDSVGLRHSDPTEAAAHFKERIFGPLLQGLKRYNIATHLAVSPRRVRSLARTFAGEFTWLGSSTTMSTISPMAKRADDNLVVLREALIKKFVQELEDDARNRKALEADNSHRSN